jgi:hypothetical protein
VSTAGGQKARTQLHHLMHLNCCRQLLPNASAIMMTTQARVGAERPVRQWFVSIWLVAVAMGGHICPSFVSAFTDSGHASALGDMCWVSWKRQSIPCFQDIQHVSPLLQDSSHCPLHDYGKPYTFHSKENNAYCKQV